METLPIHRGIRRRRNAPRVRHPPLPHEECVAAGRAGWMYAPDRRVHGARTCHACSAAALRSNASVCTPQPQFAWLSVRYSDRINSPCVCVAAHAHIAPALLHPALYTNRSTGSTGTVL